MDHQSQRDWQALVPFVTLDIGEGSPTLWPRLAPNVLRDGGQSKRRLA